MCIAKMNDDARQFLVACVKLESEYENKKRNCVKSVGRR